MPQPNILWITSDQQRWDTLGCAGNPFVRTPNLDRLAESGTLFDHAYSQSPVCTPSRSSFLTGRYPRTTRCRQNGQDIPADEALVTKMLADAGYVCGLSGKLHLSACHPKVTPVMERRIDDGYAEFHWSHHAGGGWGAHNEYHAWLAERGKTFETPEHPDCKWVRVGMPEEFHQTTWCVERAIDFIRARRGDGKPWLFSVNAFDPHHGFDPPAEYLARYLDRLDEIPLPDYVEGELADKPSYQTIDHGAAYGGRSGYPFDGMTARDHRMVRAAYWAMCDLLDAQVGRLLEALGREGQADGTLVIYTSDHGEMLGDHGIYLKGPHFYEPAIRVPLMISWPGHVKSQRSAALVELVDLAQTILDAAGLPHHAGMQGRSLWGLLTGAAAADAHREDVYCEYYNALTSHRDPTAQLTMVRTRTHKLVLDHSHSSGELYDLAADPGEHRNLWSAPEVGQAFLPVIRVGQTGMSVPHDVKTDLLIRLANRMAWTVDPLPLRRSGW